MSRATKKIKFGHAGGAGNTGKSGGAGGQKSVGGAGGKGGEAYGGGGNGNTPRTKRKSINHVFVDTAQEKDKSVMMVGRVVRDRHGHASVEIQEKFEISGGSGGNQKYQGGEGGGSSNFPFSGNGGFISKFSKVPKLNVQVITKPLPESKKRIELQKGFRAYYVTKKYTQYEFDCNYTVGYQAHCKEHGDAYEELNTYSHRLLSENIKLKQRSPVYYLLLGLVYGALFTVIIHSLYVSNSI